MDEITKRLKQRDKDLKSVERGIILALNEGLDSVVKKIKIGETTAIEAAATLSGLENAVLEAGLLDLFGEIRTIYADELENINNVLLSSGIETFSNLDQQQIAVIVDADLTAASKMIEAYLGDTKQLLVRNVLTGQLPELEVGTRLASQLTTELDTSLSALDRSLILKKSVDAFGENPSFIYLGPLDKLTRPFCQENVGRTFTLKEIRAKDNGTSLDVFTFGGGYNCRHVWRPVEQ